MIFKVLDNQMNTLTLIDTEAPSSIVLSETKITYGIYNNVRIYMMDLKVSKEKNNEEAQAVNAGNLIRFENENNEIVMLAIRKVTEETEQYRRVQCHDLGMDLLNQSAFIYQASHSQSLSYYLNRELYNTGWEVGINELPSAKRKLEFVSSENTLGRIQRLAQEFNAEIYFSLEMTNGKIKRKLINIVTKIGSDRTDVKIQSGYDMITVSKTVDTNDIKTAIIVKGIESFVYDDGRYFSLLGEATICDRVANSEWGTARTKKELHTNWLYDHLDDEYPTQQESFTAGLKQLKTKNEPIVEYQTQAIYEETRFDVGDYITIVDEDFNPALRIKARVLEKSYDPNDPTKNEFVQGNNVELKNAVNSQLLTFQQQLNTAKEENVTYEIKQANDGINRTLTCVVYQNGKDVTTTFKDTQFIWSKTDKNGVVDQFFGIQNGVSVTDSLNNVVRESIFSCKIVFYKNKYVTLRYFIDGLVNFASRIQKYLAGKSKEELKNTIVMPFITDVHYATSSTVVDSIQHMLRSDNHIKNVADFTNILECDAVLGGGDFVDGTTVKDETLSNLETIRSLFSLCECPYLLARGNHDDNSSADTRYGDYLSNMILPSELYEYIVRPSLNFGIVENSSNRNMYYYYDVPDKNFRIIVLNNFDIPYTIDADGRTKYRANKISAYRNEQVNWFAQTLKKTPSNYQVMLMEHSSLGKGMYEEYNFSKNYDLIEGIIKAYTEGTTFSKTNTEVDFKASVNVSFEKKGTIVCITNGHHHKDRLKKVAGIMDVNTICSVSNINYDNPNRPIGVLEEDAWDVFVIDTSKKHVKLYRYGAGSDREFTY